MAKEELTTKITDKYESAYPMDPKARIACGRTGINKLVGELTDDDIDKITKAGSKSFRLIPKAEVKAK